MKKIINNRVYDTDSAVLIGTADSNLLEGRKPLWMEALYRKKTGEFFLYVQGTRDSRYAVKKNGIWEAGQHIVPLPFTEARGWCKSNLKQEIFERIFSGDPEKRRPFNITLPDDLITRIKLAAEENSVTPSAYIEDIIRRDNG